MHNDAYKPPARDANNGNRCRKIDRYGGSRTTWNKQFPPKARYAARLVFMSDQRVGNPYLCVLFFTEYLVEITGCIVG